ncbi:C2H2 and C2HC zinc fingers superfamily protein [Zea mays]|uniref:C2H2 and C2HC zinc fingers superfamily protein n=2 Tax=Zea mays TaxID=4577 RepID=A0A1D6FC65_MAIZE|nr:C2H2 and C2HC zinc fingers superfamily protein [Zea mays]AQK89642.1 C2H2 and C2HC zinc fingers superfamily protein [Zea mays]
MVQQSDIIGNQPNFVVYQGVDINSSSERIVIYDKLDAYHILTSVSCHAMM